MQCKDIPDERVVELARRWQDYGRSHPIAWPSWQHLRDQDRPPGVVEALMIEFDIPYKLAYVKVESLCERKNGRPALLEYGTSPNYAWPAY